VGQQASITVFMLAVDSWLSG